MTTEKKHKKPTLDSQHVTDIDLVELAGLHAYKMKRGLNFITVNGKKFEVMNVTKDSDAWLRLLYKIKLPKTTPSSM